MSTTNSIDLYSLLPAIYRIRDAERGYPLRALLGLISGQAQLVKTDIDRLWDDLFIETCADWVVPYIGDLVANNPISEEIARTRADVAHTIYYRRRKGTLTMLEQLAGDVTGWDAHAVAFFEELGWSQNLNHLRMHEDTFTAVLTWAADTTFSVGQVITDTNGNPQQVTVAGTSGGLQPVWSTTPDGATPDGTVLWAMRGTIDPYAVDRVGTVLLRDLDTLDRLNSAFDTTTHTVDVRPPCQLTGWYDIQNVGFFLWRLQSFFTEQVAPRRSAIFPDGFHFSPLGNPAPLFVNPAPAPLGTELVKETEVQSPIRGVAFYFSPGDYYMNAALATPSLAIYHGNAANPANLIPLTRIVCGDLSNWTPPASGKVVVDVERGRFAFAPGETPVDGVTISYTYGFSGAMGGGPYDRRLKKQAGQTPDPGPAIPNTVADPIALGLLIRVPSLGINTISQAVAQWNPAVNPQAVIQVEDNRTYQENVTVPFPLVPPLPGRPVPLLVIQAGNLQRPTLLGDITVTGGTGAEEFVVNGLLMAGRLHVQGNLDVAEIVHSTLVPGIQLDEQGQAAQPDSPSILVDAPADRLRLLVDHSITGRLLVPEGMIGLFVRDSIIDSPRREAQGDFTPVLISGSFSPFPVNSATSSVHVTIGDEGPYMATLTWVSPNPTLAEARDALQTAIRAAHYTTPFRAARVLSAANRLLIVPGADEELVIEAADGDPTAAELRLDPASSRQTSAVVSGVLPAVLAITSLAPQVSVTVGTEGQAIAKFAVVPATVVQARDQLQAAIRLAGATPGFTLAVVANMDNQLVVVSGDGGGPITFANTVSDSTTVVELALETERPAIAAADAGDVPGPPTTLLRTTIFGQVHVQQLPLASEVIFNSVVISKRRQDGCVRFSFVPEGSQTPRRYRCQPDFEILQRTEEAEKLAGGPISDADRDAIRDDVRSWLQPLFTDIHYGLPGYGQLSVSCPRQIQTGAQDGSEMGAFSFLKQPQRVTSLRVRLQEYLPFGLEPGLIYVT